MRNQVYLMNAHIHMNGVRRTLNGACHGGSAVCASTIINGQEIGIISAVKATQVARTRSSSGRLNLPTCMPVSLQRL